MDAELAELISFLRDDKSVVRKGAVEAVLGLTASDDGRRLLRGTRVVDGLRRLLGDRPDIASAAVSALVNLSADGEAMEAILKAGLTGSMMESLRDPECTYKHAVLMLLTNLSQTPEGCDQLMQKGAAGGALVGLHFRRLVQTFVTSGRTPAAAAAGAGGKKQSPAEAPATDELEYAGCIVHNLTQLPEARAIIMEPERGILPALMPQLASANPLRRRAAAGVLRNCCAGTDAGAVSYLLSPGVDVVTHLLLPLAGPDVYSAGEKDGMHPSLYARGAHKAREADPPTRRLLLEGLAALAVTKPARAHLRRARAYPVVKYFHEWLEGQDIVEEEGAGGAGAGAAAPPRLPGGDTNADGDLTDPDDIAAVDAIHRLVQQLFRDDEIEHTYEVTGRNKPKPKPAEGASTTDGAADGRDDDEGPLPAVQAAAAAARARAARAEVEASKARMWKYATVPLEAAKAKAADAAHGRGRDGGPTEAELSAVTTRVPDWTEDDPELPPEFEFRRERLAQLSLQEQERTKTGTTTQEGGSSSEPAPAATDDSARKARRGDGDASAAPPAPAPAASTSTAAAATGVSTFAAVEAAGLGGVE